MRLLELENTWDSQHCINARKCILNEAKPPKEYEFGEFRHEWLEHCNHYGDVGVTISILAFLLKIIWYAFHRQTQEPNRKRFTNYHPLYLLRASNSGYPHWFRESMNWSQYRAIEVLCNYLTTWHLPDFPAVHLRSGHSISSCNLAIALECT